MFFWSLWTTFEYDMLLGHGMKIVLGGGLGGDNVFFLLYGYIW